MSFTQDVKDELARVEPTCSHCNRAVLAAIIRIEGTLFVNGPGRYRIEVATDVGSIARIVVKLLHELYNLQTEVVIRRSVLHKTPNYLVDIPAQPLLEPALIDLGILTEDGSLEMGVKRSLVSKRCCSAGYLRGCFLGSGFVSNPRGDFHFEISIENEQMANDVVELLHEAQINAKLLHRRNTYVVYLKSGTAITEFLALTGAHGAALAMENERVYKSIRNDVNRKTNAEFANQAKSASAAVDQIFAIRTVVEKYGMENLPTGLQEFIRLRVSHTDVTLRELGAFANPPLSKSAVYHRARRIEQMARDIESSKGNGRSS